METQLEEKGVHRAISVCGEGTGWGEGKGGGLGRCTGPNDRSSRCILRTTCRKRPMHGMKLDIINRKH